MTLPLFIIAGVPGAGKTTISPVLAKKLNYEFFEGATLVSDEVKARMSSGEPMTEAEHSQWMVDVIGNGHHLEKESAPKGIVGTCTALTRRVRNMLRNEVKKLNEQGSELKLFIVWLDVTKEESVRRAEARKGHYYNPAMTDWLFARIEIPCTEGAEKEDDTYMVDANQPVEDVIRDALKILDVCT